MAADRSPEAVRRCAGRGASRVAATPRKRPRLRLLVALLAFGLATASEAAAASALYPDLKTLPPRDLRFDRADVSADGSGNVHNVLRFSNTVWNAGEGRLELRGLIDPATKSGPAVERVYDTDGGFADHTVGTFYYHVPHDHYHLDGWGRYQLWTKAEYDDWVASGRSRGQAKKVGVKTTSCVPDDEFVRTLPGTPFPGVYKASECMPGSDNLMVQGLSVGWGDTYDYFRFEQWIDLDQSTLTDGTYVLRSVTDPDNKLYESANKNDSSREGERDNEAITVFTVQGGAILDSDPPSGTIRINNVDAQTSSPNVTVRVLGRDDVSGVDKVRLSNDGTRWATYDYTASGTNSQPISWDLTNPTYGGTSATGTKTVYAQFHDSSGKWSASETDTIVLVSSSSSYSGTVLSDSPVGYWRLGESSGTTASDSTGSNHGTYVNSPSLGAPSLLTSDSANPAVQFDGTNDHVRVANSSSLSISSTLTLEAWIRAESLPSTGQFASIVTKKTAYSLQFNGPQLELTIIQGRKRRRLKAPAGAIATNRTYHVVGTYNGSTQRLYINGSEVANRGQTGGIKVNSNSLYIGSWSGSTEFFSGVIDEVAVYKSTLSPSRVAAHYDAGGGGASVAPQSVGPEGLAAPSDLEATAASGERIDLRWSDNSSNETSFVVERSTDSDFSSAETIELDANTTSYSDTGLSPGTKYHYRVKAANDTDTSDYSNPATATTGSPAEEGVAAPSDLSAKAGSKSRINLTWKDNSSNETSFVLERSTDSDFGSPETIELDANTTSYSDTGLSPGTRYYYRVKAANDTDTSDYSNTASAKTPGQ